MGNRVHSYSFQRVIPNPRALMQKELDAFSCMVVVSIANGESGMQSARPHEGSVSTISVVLVSAEGKGK